MKEAVLHQFWNPIWLKKDTFKGTRSESLKIRNFGTLNPLQGPDFIGAEVEIDGLVQYGAIEIHLQSSHWDEHQHQQDPRYNQVVLHVVWFHNREICNQLGNTIPTLCLEDHFTEKDLQKMQVAQTHKRVYPCKNAINNLDADIRNEQLNDAAFNRLIEQSEECFQLAASVNFDWERVLFIRMLAYCVDPQNRMSALQLARQLPLKIFRRYPESDYLGWIIEESGLWRASPKSVQKQTEIYLHTYKKNVFPRITDVGAWQHRNLRPGSYPLVRIGHFFNWVGSRKGYWDDLLAEQSHTEADINLMSGSWNELQRGKLIQNALLPVWGARRMFLGLSLDSSLLNILEAGTFELNRITSEIRFLLPVQKYQQRMSYGLIQQYKQYCSEKRCSHCKIGKAMWNVSQ